MSIDDTRKRTALDHLTGMSVMGSDKYIQSMEKEGQRQVIESSQIPVARHFKDEILEKLGFTLGPKPRAVDVLFQDCALPPNWKRTGGSHDMWSHIRDEQGRERFGIFYKAAFYDRRASMSLTPLFHINEDYDRGDAEKRRIYEVKVQIPPSGAGTLYKVLHTVVSAPYTDRYSDESRAAAEATRLSAVAWLDEKYPDWQNPLTHWETKI
jgi:hypothetical protein